ncbi:hypothetical protein PLICRDRAFT_445033 [Plicaturopsis crispa FD-325 SS-3]|uniref:Cytochrome P450 n=1 Tax=Plicaturopsis crispa FD-325 SS-3 TaxID=944288 RepID=A0A0C9SKE8_PLICR|nr:hypothetical protein PLICRDRAFT_445033 [Plicaturopsis crispa FD-325 SS-3]
MDMGILISILQAVVALAVSWALWRTYRKIFGKSCLDNIPGPPSESFSKGNLGQFFDINPYAFHEYLHSTFGKAMKIHGMFGDEQLYVYDPLALHHIVVKDQLVYEETSVFVESNRPYFGPGLLSSLGDEHRKQRKLLNPVFSIKHMREMVPMFYKICEDLRDVIKPQVSNGPAELNMLDYLSRAALELIGQAGLGYSFDALNMDIQNEFANAAREFQGAESNLYLVRQFLPWLVTLGPAWLRRRAVDLLPSKDVRHLRDTVDIVQRSSVDIFEQKKRAFLDGEAAVLQQVGQGKDIMSVLLKANMEANEQDRLPDEELIAQMSTLIFAAFDTTSSALSRILCLLAEHPEVQEKLRTEITEARQEKGDLDYDDLVALPYLEAICRETLRVHAPVPFMSRTVRKDTVLPLSQPIKGVDGTDVHGIPLSKDTNVIVGLLAVNCDTSIWGEDAAEWKPERWLAPLPDSVADAHVPGVYANLMTFLAGSRACIGFKFSQLEMKIVLCLLIESFRFAPAKDLAWNMGAIQFPRAVGTSNSALPLKVSLVERATRG